MEERFEDEQSVPPCGECTPFIRRPITPDVSSDDASSPYLVPYRSIQKIPSIIALPAHATASTSTHHHSSQAHSPPPQRQRRTMSHHSKRVYIGRIAPSVSCQDISDLLYQYRINSIQSVHSPTLSLSHRTQSMFIDMYRPNSIKRDYGFIEFDRSDDSEEASRR